MEATVDDFEHADQLVIDLDPGEAMEAGSACRRVSSNLSHNGPERRGDRAAAVVAFLQEVLTNKSLTVADLEVRARAAGLLGEHQRITDAKHFKRAKAKLNIKSWRHGFGSRGAWFWSLSAQFLLAERRHRDGCGLHDAHRRGRL